MDPNNQPHKQLNDQLSRRSEEIDDQPETVPGLIHYILEHLTWRNGPVYVLLVLGSIMAFVFVQNFEYIANKINDRREGIYSVHYELSISRSRVSSLIADYNFPQDYLQVWEFDLSRTPSISSNLIYGRIIESRRQNVVDEEFISIYLELATYSCTTYGENFYCPIIKGSVLAGYVKGIGDYNPRHIRVLALELSEPLPKLLETND